MSCGRCTRPGGISTPLDSTPSLSSPVSPTPTRRISDTPTSRHLVGRMLSIGNRDCARLGTPTGNAPRLPLRGGRGLRGNGKHHRVTTSVSRLSMQDRLGKARPFLFASECKISTARHDEHIRPVSRTPGNQGPCTADTTLGISKP